MMFTASCNVEDSQDILLSAVDCASISFTDNTAPPIMATTNARETFSDILRQVKAIHCGQAVFSSLLVTATVTERPVYSL